MNRLHEQAVRGDTARIDSSLNSGVYVDCEYRGETALYVAARKGQAESVARLLERGANPNWQSAESGRTPLHAAIHLGGNLATVKALIDAGANAHLKDWDGGNTLHQAAQSNVSTEMLKYLLRFEFNVHDKTNSGSTPIIFSGASANPRIAEMLLDRGATPNDMDNYQYTALLYAADRGNFETAKVLVERGARVNTVGMDGNTALTMACRRRKYDITRLLLEHDADPFIKDGDGKSADEYIKRRHALAAKSVKELKNSPEDASHYEYSKQMKATCEELFDLVEEYRKRHHGSR